MKTRLLSILIALDVLLFALLCLGNVRRSECASSAAWDCLLHGKWQGRVFVPIIDSIFFFDPAHCRSSWQAQQTIYAYAAQTTGGVAAPASFEPTQPPAQ